MYEQIFVWSKVFGMLKILVLPSVVVNIFTYQNALLYTDMPLEKSTCLWMRRLESTFPGYNAHIFLGGKTVIERIFAGVCKAVDGSHMCKQSHTPLCNMP